MTRGFTLFVLGITASTCACDSREPRAQQEKGVEGKSTTTAEKPASTPMMILIESPANPPESIVRIENPADWSKTISFKGPSGTSPESLEKAARSLVGRCEASGYTGVSSRIAKGRVEITRAEGWTDEMQMKVAFDLAFTPMARFDVAVLYELPEAERGRYKADLSNLNNLKTWEKPVGAEWLRLGESHHCFLVRQELQFSVGSLERVSEKDMPLEIRFSAEQTNRLLKLDPKLLGDIVLYADGSTLLGTFQPRWRFEGNRPADRTTVIELYDLLSPTSRIQLAHPLPFELHAILSK